MKTDKFDHILANRVIGITSIDNFFKTDEEMKLDFIKNLKSKLYAEASYKSIMTLLGEDNKYTDMIANILVDHNMDTAYKLYDQIRDTLDGVDLVENFHLIQYLFFDRRKKLVFLMHCYIEDVNLPSDIDEYNSGAIFNSAYSNDYIIEVFKREFADEQFLTPEERELCNDMMAAILKINHHQELLKKSYE